MCLTISGLVLPLDTKIVFCGCLDLRAEAGSGYLGTCVGMTGRKEVEAQDWKCGLQGGMRDCRSFQKSSDCVNF